MNCRKSARSRENRYGGGRSEVLIFLFGSVHVGCGCRLFYGAAAPVVPCFVFVNFVRPSSEMRVRK